ncbi:FAD-binding oxidoreductase [Erwinia sp. P6884]|uniref:FAD-binding oxidoreductase n=1 Tax=Erwinia sp. P6884 TaxID=3141450 RepID=UPI00318A0365
MNARIISKLEKHIEGHIHSGREAGQKLRTGLWNGIDEVNAALSVCCTGLSDLQNAIRIAAEYDMPVSVLGGGHDWYRRSVSQEGITLDLRAMRQVSVSRENSALTAAGGAIVKNAIDVLPEGYALVTGVHTQVGLAGLALGGGYGKLNARFGLVADNLRKAQVVLADGSLATVSEKENPDLFWALKGAGKNFGVLASAEFAIHRLSPVLSATLFIKPEYAQKGLRNLQEILDEAGDRLSVFSTFSALPGKGRGLILEPLWTGDEAAGEEYIRQLSSLPGASVVKKSWSEYRDIYDDASDRSAWPKGRGYQMDAFNLNRLDEETAGAVIDCCLRMPSGQNCIMLHDFRGRAARVASDATAFSHRRDHYNMQIVAGWQTDAEKTQGNQWISEIQNIIAPFSDGSAYPAVTGSDGQERARKFYGESLNKLRVMKKRFDAGNRFNAPYGLF